MGEWLSELRGAQVDLRVPSAATSGADGDRQAQRGAGAGPSQDDPGGGPDTRSLALQELQDGLDLDSAPLRIECFDVSHVQGTNVVASMVVFEDGLPRKAEYRRFLVKAALGPDGRGQPADRRHGGHA
jgi:excinuclease ABC subunit C